MTEQMSSLMSDWLRKRQLLREAEEQHDELAVAVLDREALAAFTSLRDAVREMDEAA